MAAGRAAGPPPLADGDACGPPAIGVVLWLPPLADQIRNSPGNIRTLLDHFGSPPESAIGFGEGIPIALRHLDVTALDRPPPVRHRPVRRRRVGRGAAASCWPCGPSPPSWPVRLGSRALRALHLVVGVALLLGVVSTARIFGRPWYYLTLWAWGTTMLALGAVAWSARDAVAARGAPSVDVRRPVIAGAAGAWPWSSTVVATVDFADAHHPEERLSDAVGALAGPTYDAIVDGAGVATGVDGRYIVRWSDAADIGSPGFGLLDELERRGLDVAADEYFRVPGHRPPDPATVRQRRPDPPRHRRLHRSLAGRARRRRGRHVRPPHRRPEGRSTPTVRARFIERLTAEGLEERIADVDFNLFGISTDVRLQRRRPGRPGRR